MFCNDDRSKVVPESTRSRVSKVQPVDNLDAIFFQIFAM